jgi:2-keto-4-pentenoate hydratase/2-oxohepta-3-ene-1,7-dioic acid hydratase in catechol pathway
MRLATIQPENGPRQVVVVRETDCLPLRPEHDLLTVLALAPAARDALVAETVASGVDWEQLAQHHLVAPLTPTTLRDFMTFEQHLAGAIKWVNPGAPIAPEWYEAPCFYFTNPLAVVGHDSTVEFPPGCEVLDFELELGVVLKSGGRDLTIAQAEDCIGGYTILNDWSARDIQSREMRIGLGPVKGKDFATSIGPWVVTPDELAPFLTDDRLDLLMTARINDRVVGQDTAAHMAWSFAEMIAYASRGAEVAPGDVLGSGTCGGGCLAELWGWAGKQDPPPLRAGDTVSFEVQGIGRLSNRLVDGRLPVPVPVARRFDVGVRLG